MKLRFTCGSMMNSRNSAASSFLNYLPLPVMLVLLDQAIVSGTRLLSQVAIARFGTSSGLGVGFYVSTFGFVVLAVMFAESYITTPINVFLPRQSNADRPGFFGGSLRVLIKFILLGGAVFGGLSLVAFFTQSAIARQTTLTLLWYFPLHIGREYGRRCLLATRRHGELVLFDALVTAVLISLIGLTVWGSRLDAVVMFGITSLANLLFVAVWWKRSKNEMELSALSEDKFRKATKGYGHWVAAEGIFSVIQVYFSQWYITAAMGETQADRFGVCLTLVFVANPFLLGVTSFFSPKAAQDFSDGGWAALQKSSVRFGIFVLVVLLMLAVAVWLGGDWLLTSVFGDKFHGLGSTVTILGFGMVFLGLSYLFATTLQAITAPQVNVVASVVAGVFVVVYSLLFINNELRSAAWCFFFSALIGASIRIIGLGLLRRSSK